MRNLPSRSSDNCNYSGPIEFFTNMPQNKNANVANFVLAVSLEKSWTTEACNIEMQYTCLLHFTFTKILFAVAMDLFH